MDFDIQLRFRPSAAFVGILAELNERYSDWTDGSYDWADQTKEFLHRPAPLPQFDESLFQSPLSRRALNDLLQVSIALMSGNYPLVRDYLKALRFAFVIGYPRSGGSYLTKELLRAVGLNHTRVSEALAHDGFPDLRSTWYDWAGDRPYYHLQDAIFQTAEFLVIANLYYRRKTAGSRDGVWLAPKKMHKLVAWASSFKMLLGQGRADYLVTVRHPVPTCVSIYEKSGGWPPGGRFPVTHPRSAIEYWIMSDLMHLGYTAEAIAQMDYFEAVQVSWSYFYTQMAISGLFLGDREEIQVIPYGKRTLEAVAHRYHHRRDGGSPSEPEDFLVRDTGAVPAFWLERGDAAVTAVARVWETLGLRFPALSRH